MDGGGIGDRYVFPCVVLCIILIILIDRIAAYAGVVMLCMAVCASVVGGLFIFQRYRSTEIDMVIRLAKANVDCQTQLASWGVMPEKVVNVSKSDKKASKPRLSASTAPERITSRLNDFGLDLRVVGEVNAPQITRYLCETSGRTNFDNIRKKADDIQIALVSNRPVLVTKDRGKIAIDVPKSKTDFIPSKNLSYNHDQAIPVGVAVDGNQVFLDFDDPNQAHLLVAGQTGGGKSEFLKVLVAGLDKMQACLAIVDMKMLTFGDRSDCVTEAAQGADMIRQAVIMMNERYSQLASEGFEGIGQRLESGHISDMKRYFVIIDEYAELVMSFEKKSERKKLENSVIRIAQKGRAAGVHVIVATQRPDATIVTPVLKANLSSKVCFKVATHHNSGIVINQPGAESLIGMGDALADFGGGLFRFQSAYIERK